jgi:ATP-dependent DNA ligase
MASPTTPARRRAEQASPRAWIKPQLAALVKRALDGPDWLHEIKLDGYRMHARLDAGRVQILTRRGNDWTHKYPGIAKAIAGLPAQNAYLDGELCGVLPDGRTAFNLIQNAGRIVTETEFGRATWWGRLPAWISSPTDGIASHRRSSSTRSGFISGSH